MAHDGTGKNAATTAGAGVCWVGTILPAGKEEDRHQCKKWRRLQHRQIGQCWLNTAVGDSRIQGVTPCGEMHSTSRCAGALKKIKGLIEEVHQSCPAGFETRRDIRYCQL